MSQATDEASGRVEADTDEVSGRVEADTAEVSGRVEADTAEASGRGEADTADPILQQRRQRVQLLPIQPASPIQK